MWLENCKHQVLVLNPTRVFFYGMFPQVVTAQLYMPQGVTSAEAK